MKRMFTVLAMVLAALSISFMACSVSSDNDDSSITANGVVNAEIPIIRTGLADGTYTVGDTATALTVTATVTDGGELSYKWYKGDELISGATSKSYTPSTAEAGTFTYKVVVTNTNNNVNGKTTATADSSATVTVIDSTKTNAEKPVSITGITGTTKYKQGDTASALTIEATVKDGGTLTYQWYKGEELIEGATSASYTPDTTTAGTFIYKVRVTNTNNNVNGNKTAIEDFNIQVTITAIVNAATPLIRTGLADGTYTVGAKATALSVEATVSDGGTLSYQWYKDSTVISGATSASYTPDTKTAGTFTYKVVVTNTNNNVNGKTTATAESSATVTVNGNEDKIGSGNISFDFN